MKTARDILAEARNDRDEIRRLRRILYAILYYDERGQGIGYAEAMHEAAMAIDYDSAAARGREVRP